MSPLLCINIPERIRDALDSSLQAESHTHISSKLKATDTWSIELIAVGDGDRSRSGEAWIVEIMYSDRIISRSREIDSSKGRRAAFRGSKGMGAIGW